MSGKMSAKWDAGTSARVSINLSQGACIENRVVSTGILEQIMRYQVK